MSFLAEEYDYDSNDKQNTDDQPGVGDGILRTASKGDSNANDEHCRHEYQDYHQPIAGSIATRSNYDVVYLHDVPNRSKACGHSGLAAVVRVS